MTTVAPFTGAWIETDKTRKNLRWVEVAPFTGAWIETEPLPSGTSLGCVAPFTGAWIETCLKLRDTLASAKSLPSRERGLKPDAVANRV